MDEGWYVEKTTFADDNTVYKANYHIHRDNAQTESQGQLATGNVEISKIISTCGESNGQELKAAGYVNSDYHTGGVFYTLTWYSLQKRLNLQ